MTFNVLEYARGLGLPLVFSSTREVYGDVHRFEEYAEEAADFAYTESPYSASKITSEAFIYSYARCYGLSLPRLPLLERLRTLRQRPVAHGARAAALHAPARARRGRHGLRRRTRCSTSRTSTTASTASSRGVDALGDGRVANQTINLAYGAREHARPRGGADRRRARRAAADHDRAVAARRGDPLRRRRDEGARRSSTGSPQTPLDEGIPKAVAWFREWRAAHPEENRPFERPRSGLELEHGFKQPAGAGA